MGVMHPVAVAALLFSPNESTLRHVLCIKVVASLEYLPELRQVF